MSTEATPIFAQPDRSDLADRYAMAVAALADANEQLAELNTWQGLMTLLDTHWPVDIFPVLPDSTERDEGPRILSLVRHLAAARADQRRWEFLVSHMVGIVNGPKPGQCQIIFGFKLHGAPSVADAVDAAIAAEQKETP